MKCNKCKSQKECAKTRTVHTKYDKSIWRVRSVTHKTMYLCTSCGATQDTEPVNVKIDCSYDLYDLMHMKGEDGYSAADMLQEEIDRQIIEKIVDHAKRSVGVRFFDRNNRKEI